MKIAKKENPTVADVDEWWAQTDVDTRSKILLVYPSDFSDMGGSLDFMMFCNGWWKKKPIEHKIYYYKKYA